MTRWLLISGDFTPLGGMDRANHALAGALAEHADVEVHLVTHRACDDLERRPAVRVHRVPRPFGSHLLGAPLLAAAGERWARRLNRDRARIIANGGNADGGDVSWVHYLHAVHTPVVHGSARRRLQTRAAHRYYVARERNVLARARLIICNSHRTARDVVERLAIPDSRVRTVYYGADGAQLSPIAPEERAAARRDLGWIADRPIALFIGALGDRRKGFDRLFDAWARLCADPGWDVDLAVAGSGGEVTAWRGRAATAPLAGRMRFLGFRTDIPRLLAASDLLIHPARYEAYGLGVHEAICRGLPAIVSATAGVAEQYPLELRDLLIGDVERDELLHSLRRWRADMAGVLARVRPFADRLRARSWNDMAADIVRMVQA